MKRRNVVMLAVPLLVAAAGQAQEKPGPLLEVSTFKVKYGKAGAWLDQMKKLYVPMLDRLVSEGALQSYGIEFDILHNAGTPNAAAWFLVKDYSAYEKVMNGIEEVQKSNASAMSQFFEISDMEQHHDFLFRVESSASKPAAAGSRPYNTVSRWKIKRGKGQEFRKGFDKYEKPVLDKLVADGTMLGYFLLREEVHSTEPGTYWLAAITPTLAAIDKVDAAFEAENKKRSEVERAALQKEFEEMTVEGSHRDFVTRAEVYVAK